MLLPLWMATFIHSFALSPSRDYRNLEGDRTGDEFNPLNVIPAIWPITYEPDFIGGYNESSHSEPSEKINIKPDLNSMEYKGLAKTVEKKINVIDDNLERFVERKLDEEHEAIDKKLRTNGAMKIEDKARVSGSPSTNKTEKYEMKKEDNNGANLGKIFISVAIFALACLVFVSTINLHRYTVDDSLRIGKTHGGKDNNNGNV